MKKGIVSVISMLLGAGVGAGTVGRTMTKSMQEWRNMSDKHLALFLMMNQWVKVKQEGKMLADYLLDREYKSIAVYGMSYAGETLLSELLGSGVEVAYAIDKNVVSVCDDIEVLTPDDSMEKVDAVIVTSITFFEEIKENLSRKMSCPILSIEDILYEI